MDDLFNIELLILNNENTKYFPVIKTAEIFEPSSKIFHHEGLFSLEYFGPIGSQIRNEREAVIDIKIPIIHPLVFLTACTLDSKIEKIASGKMYVTFDERTSSYVLSDKNEGYTGYNYLVSTIDKYKFVSNDSTKRQYKIELCNKYWNTKSLITKWPVIPAGIRDYKEDKKGLPTEDEINNLYRSLIMTASFIHSTSLNVRDLEMLDAIRYRLQRSVIAIYEYIKELIDGKHKFIQAKFTSRATVNGTRNVLTPSVNRITDLTSNTGVRSNHTTMGLYQYVKAINPITVNKLQSKFINHIFNPNEPTALLVNKKTMLSELTQVPVKKRDKWLTSQGINDIMNKLAQDEIKEEAISIDDEHYLMLVYEDKDNIEVILDTNDLEDREDIDREKLRPITYGELFYLAIEDVVDKYPAFVTRYPVAALGGIYPCWVYLKTTVNGKAMDVTIGNVRRRVLEYPIRGEKWYRSVAVDSRNIKRLGADFDGDVISTVLCYAEDSIIEIKKYLSHKKAYLTSDNKITYSSSDDVAELVMSTLTE